MKVILVMAMTADGMIARNSMELVDWTGKADKQYFVQVTKKAGIMIMGSKTFDTIGRALPGRKSIVLTRNKDRKSKQSNLEFTDQAPETLLAGLSEQGYETATLIGGAEINGLFMENGLVDEIHVTVVPRFYGKGLSLFSSTLDVHLELIEAVTLEPNCLLIKYTVKRG